MVKKPKAAEAVEEDTSSATGADEDSEWRKDYEALRAELAIVQSELKARPADPELKEQLAGIKQALSEVRAELGDFRRVSESKSKPPKSEPTPEKSAPKEPGATATIESPEEASDPEDHPEDHPRAKSGATTPPRRKHKPTLAQAKGWL
jgi:hypothetical protein